MSVLFGSFFKRPQTRQFHLEPRYHDPDAEAREARRRAILGDDYDGDYKPGMLIREGRLLRMQEQERQRRKSGQRNWIRTVIFLVGVVVVLWVMFSYLGKVDWFDN